MYSSSTREVTLTMPPRSSEPSGIETNIARKDELYDRALWTETLSNFSRATGLTISFFDRKLNLKCTIPTANPIGVSLAGIGFWEPGGLGHAIDRAAAEEAAFKQEVVFGVKLDIFSHLALPLILDGKVVATFVLGWIPEKFADPVLCDAFAKRIQIPPMEIWQLMRMQQPISKQKLEAHAQMVATFAAPLMRQLMDQIEDQARGVRAMVVSATSLKFAEATTEIQLCNAAFASIQQLVGAKTITINLIQSANGLETLKTYKQSSETQDERDRSESTLDSHLTIPIPAPVGRPSGKIEVTIENNGMPDESLQALQTVASQFGIALQKVSLISVLENERIALKTANAQLHQMHKLKDEFLATVSHELRTPLNAILGWSQIIRDEGPNIPEFNTAMDTISRNATNQSHLIEDLLDVSRIISGKMILQREEIEATQLLRDSIKTVFPMTEARHQTVHTQISSTPLYFKGDATRITQIFWNLLSNASKFTPEGGAISVVLDSAGHYFKLEISDSGKGISKEFLPHLFDRFSQADGSFTRRHGGLGLGLAIVRHLVELHGGTVRADSDGEGKGSKFTVFLPQKTTDLELDAAQKLTAVSESQKTSVVRKLEGLKILLVDDEPDALRLARFVLERYGAITEAADSASDAYEVLKEWRPDIILSDLSMPNESGFDLIRRIRALPQSEGGGIPVIALTALAGKEHREQALIAGFNGHIAKPVEPNELVEQVRLFSHSMALAAPAIETH